MVNILQSAATCNCSKCLQHTGYELERTIGNEMFPRKLLSSVAETNCRKSKARAKGERKSEREKREGKERRERESENETERKETETEAEEFTSGFTSAV